MGRKRLEPPLPAADMTGRVCLVTGANSGIGRATAAGLARLGATVVMACRDERRGRRALESIARGTAPDRLHLILADLSTTAGVLGLAEAVRERFDRLDVLVNNAAVLTRRRRLTPEGFELQFFVNHLAYFLLTNALLDRLRASAPARVVNVASTAHSRGVIDFDDLQGERGYKGWQQYANTKLMNIVFTYELARRLEGTGVTANCLHPGVIHTGLLRNFSAPLNVLFHLLGAFFKSPEEGAVTSIYLAASPEVEGVSGKYFKYCRPVGTSPVSRDPEVQRRLWEQSDRLTRAARARGPGATDRPPT